PVGEQQRHGVRPGRADVREVHVLPVDLGAELRERVEPVLLGPPVEPIPPVFGEFAQVAGVYAVVPADSGQGVRPPAAVDPPVQLVDVVLRDPDTEPLDRFAHGAEGRSDRGPFVSAFPPAVRSFTRTAADSPPGSARFPPDTLTACAD